MKNNKTIKNIYKNVHTTEELDKKIFDNTIYKNKKNFNVRKLVVATCIVFFSLLTVVVAKEYIYKYVLNKGYRDDGSYIQTVSIDKPVNIIQNKNYSCNDATTLSKLEKDLGIKFVFDNTKYNETISECDIKLNELGEIEKVNIKISEFYDYSKENAEIDLEYDENFTQEEYYKWNSKRKIIGMNITFMTPEAEEETKEEFKNLAELTGTSEIKNVEFFAENINTVGFYFTTPSERIQLSKNAIFVHKNILYVLYANKNVTIEELLEVINEF